MSKYGDGDGDVWAGRVTDWRSVPWMSDLDHRIGVSIARQIATDLIRHQRWRTGNGEPVYMVYGEASVRYVGDDAYDQVRCQTGPDVIHLGPIEGWLRRSLEESSRTVYELIPGMCEYVYRRMYRDRMRRAAELRDALQEAIASGLIEADEPISRAVSRLMRAGYTAGTLRSELARLP